MQRNEVTAPETNLDKAGDAAFYWIHSLFKTLKPQNIMDVLHNDTEDRETKVTDFYHI